MKISRTIPLLLLTLACARSEASQPGPQSGARAGAGAPDAGPLLGAPVDEVISARARDAILADRALQPEASRIGVATRNGIVTLSGAASSEDLKRRTEVVVRSVGSVVGVVNHLVVGSSEALSAVMPAGPTLVPAAPMESSVDREISDRVRSALGADSAVAPEALGIRVSTQGGIVSLAGAVTLPSVRDRASIVSAAVGSVVRVENHLVARPK